MNPIDLEPSNLVDGNSTSAWRCTYDKDPRPNSVRWDPSRALALGESVTFTFPSPQAFHSASVLSGYLKEQQDGNGKMLDRYAANGKVTAIRWSFPGSGHPDVVQERIPVFADYDEAMAGGWATITFSQPIIADQVVLTIEKVNRRRIDPNLRGSAALSEVRFN